MKSFTWLMAMLALCSWSFVPSMKAMARPGTDGTVLDCEDEDGEDEGRTLDCEDEDGEDEGRTLDCEDEDGEDEGRTLDCEDEDGEDEGRAVSSVLDCDDDHEEGDE